MLIRAFVVVTLAVLIDPVLAARAYAKEKGWSLRELPLLEPVADQPATAQESQRIRALIKDLAQIDAPDVAYSSTMAADTFSPVPNLDYWNGWTVTRHNLKRSASLTKLVEFGAKALPFLLDSLSDRTPTKLTLRPPFSSDLGQGSRDRLLHKVALILEQAPDGGMEAGREMACNPMNLEEARALNRANIPQQAGYSIGSGMERLKDLPSGHIRHYRYTVTVGDICFVAIGQITNRPYQAARYQSTGFVVVNSPAHDAKLADAVRTVWTGKRYYQRLFASLLTDFHTRGADDRGSSERLQIGAAVRLLYYFPGESGPVVARRLRELDVATKKSDSRKGHGTGRLWWVAELLQAVSFSRHTEVRQALLEIFRGTVHPPIALATLSAVPHEQDSEALTKLKVLVKALPAAEEAWDADGYLLLKAIGERFPDKSAAVFREYARNGSAQRRLTLCRVLRERWAARLAIELLTPLLSDKAQAGNETYRASPNSYEPQLPVRICDEAAQTLAAHRQDIHFKLEGSHKDLDDQLERIRQALGKKPGS
jgi:hypothetical protein